MSAQRAMKFEALFAVQDLGPGCRCSVCSAIHSGSQPSATHCWGRALIAAFIDIGEFILVKRIVTMLSPSA